MVAGLLPRLLPLLVLLMPARAVTLACRTAHAMPSRSYRFDTSVSSVTGAELYELDPSSAAAKPSDRLQAAVDASAQCSLALG